MDNIYDNNIQAELIRMLGERLAMDIDNEIMNSIINSMSRLDRLENCKDISEMDIKEIESHIDDIFGVIHDV